MFWPLPWLIAFIITGDLLCARRIVGARTLGKVSYRSCPLQVYFELYSVKESLAHRGTLNSGPQGLRWVLTDQGPDLDSGLCFSLFPGLILKDRAVCSSCPQSTQEHVLEWRAPESLFNDSEQ